MPIYEYECQKCGKRLEAVQKFSDPLLTECPDCKGILKKLVSNTSFVLKGTGWYVTDFAGKKKADSSSGKEVKKSGGNGKAPGGKDKPVETAASSPEAKTEKKAAPAPSSTPNNP